MGFADEGVRATFRGCWWKPRRLPRFKRIGKETPAGIIRLAILFCKEHSAGNTQLERNFADCQ